MKKLTSVICIILLMLSLAVCAGAENYDFYDDGIVNELDGMVDGVLDSVGSVYGEDYDFSAPDSGGAFIIDDADLISDSDEAALQTKIDDIRTKYAIDVVIHTTFDRGAKSIVDYADDYYDYNGYAEDGMIFVIDMSDRSYYTSTKGACINYFTDYAILDDNSLINAAILPYLSDGDFAAAFDVYLSALPQFIDEYLSGGEAFDYNNDFEGYIGDNYYTGGKVKPSTGTIIKRELIFLAIALVIGLIVGQNKKNKLNTARIKTEAADYVVPGSFVLTKSADIFAGTHVTKTAIPKESKSGGSSTHTSSSGSSHGGGGGHF